MTRIWAELRGPEFAGLDPASIAILPIGSAEQHGPHLPLNTDFVVADSLAGDVVAAHGPSLGLYLLPSMAVSKSNEHAWSPGTLRPRSTLRPGLIRLLSAVREQGGLALPL